MAPANLSRLMRISWDIQRKRSGTRAQSLAQAWVIYRNEDIAIEYLTRRLNGSKPLKAKVLNQFSLFVH